MAFKCTSFAGEKLSRACLATMDTAGRKGRGALLASSSALPWAICPPAYFAVRSAQKKRARRLDTARSRQRQRKRGLAKRTRLTRERAPRKAVSKPRSVFSFGGLETPPLLAYVVAVKACQHSMKPGAKSAGRAFTHSETTSVGKNSPYSISDRANSKGPSCCAR